MSQDQNTEQSATPACPECGCSNGQALTAAQRERALDAAYEVKGRELSYTEEQWLTAALDALEGGK